MYVIGKNKPQSYKVIHLAHMLGHEDIHIWCKMQRSHAVCLSADLREDQSIFVALVPGLINS